ncbi:MAG: M56 family metallopeptidase [Verrucomicrobiota bacterium]
MSASSWQAVWLLAVEVAAVVGLTWLIAWRLRSVVWQRTLWQASLIAIAGLLVMEFAALTPDFIRKEVQADTPVMEIKAEAMEVSTPVNEPVEIAATELSITIPTEPLVSLEPVAAMAPVKEEVVLTADRVTVSTETKAEEAAVKSSADKFPLGLALLLLVWMVGSLVLAGRLLVGRFLLLRFCAGSGAVGDERLGERVQGIAGKLGLRQGVQVLETGRIQTPVVFGLFRLTIALPVGFAEKFERRQQEAILAHELAHLAARDPLWYLLADALVSVLWWHPLVWVARARLQVTSELAADEACVLAKHGPETLAECLVTIAKEMHGQGALESIGIEGSGFRSRLGQRVERLLKLSAEVVARPAKWRTRLVKAGLPVVLVGVLLVGSGWVRRDQSAPWSGLMSGAWNVVVGVLKTEEMDIRREPRRPLLAMASGRDRTTIPSTLESKAANQAAEANEVQITLAEIEKVLAQTDEASKLIQEGKRLYDQHQFEEALAKFEEAGKRDPSNRVGFYFHVATNKEIMRERIQQSLGRDKGQTSKLDAIKLKKTILNRMPLDEVVRFLNVESRNQDVAKLGVDFSVEGKFLLGSVGEINLGVVVIDRELPEGVSLRQALDAICAGAENPIQYEEKNGGVVFQAKAIAAPAKPPEPVAGSQRIFNVVQPKLNSIVIPKLQFKGMALSNALEILQREAKAADLEGEGLEIAMDEKMKQSLWFKPMFVTIEPPLMNLTLREAIGAVTTAARHGTQAGVTYRTTDIGVRVELLPEQSGWQRVYRMDMARWIGELERVTASKLQPPWDSPAPMTTEQRNVQAQILRDMVKRQLQEGKVVFSTDEKGQQVPAFFINDRSGFVLVKGNLAQLEQVEDLLRPYQLSRAGEQAGGTSPAVRTNLPPMNKAEYGEALEELLKVRLKGAEFQRKRNEQYFPAVDLVRTRASGVQVKKLEDFVPLKEVETNVLVEVHLAKIPQERLGEFGFQLALAPMDGSMRTTTLPEGVFKRIRENLEKGGPFMQLSKTNLALKTDARGRVAGYQGEDYAIVPKAYDDGHTVEVFILKARADNSGRPRGLTSSGFQRLLTGQTKAVMFPESSGTFEVIYVTASTTDKEGKKHLADPDGPYAGGLRSDPFLLHGSMGGKLGLTRIATIGFANKPLSEVRQLLSAEVNRGRKADDQIYFFLNDKVTGKDGPVAKPGLEDLRITIDPPMENNSIEAVLKAISASTSREVGKGLKHVVTSAGVMWMWNVGNPIAPVFAPASVEANAKTVSPVFAMVFKQFDPEVFVRGVEKLTGKDASDLTNIRTTEAELVQTMARLLFASEGANMDASTEAGAQVQLNFMDRTGDFFVRAALEDRDRIMKAVEKARAAGKIEVMTPVKEPVQSPNSKSGDEVKLPTPNPYVRTNVARTLTKAQQRIEAKLDQVVIKEVFFDGLPLAEVVRFLREESAKQDPDKVGINFVINSKLDDQPGGGSKTADPLGAPEDLRVVLVTINPPLKNLTMREMLSAITNATAHVGKHGLDYRVEDFGVTFRQRVIDPPQLFTRIFKIDPAIFAEGLQRVWANSGMPANSSTNLQDMWRDFIRQAGVVVGTNNATATQIFYNDKTGVLMVRASLKDLEVIQSTIEVLNIIPPQVQMIGQYVEMSREAAKALGFNPVDSLRTRVTPAWIDETRLVVDIPTNKNVLVLGADAPPRMRTVSEEKREKLLTDLKAGGYHYHLMNAGEQVTADGRQAQVGFATDFETALVAAGRVENWASHMGVIPSFLARPKVYPDGETIRLDWVACLTQVLGHDNSPTRFRNPVKAEDPVPKFRVRYSSGTTFLKVGETLMVEGGLVEKDGNTWVTVMMLTPHLVDPAGNRMK